jgi:hypothetical protein
MTIEVGKWYHTKRDFLCLIYILKQDESVIVQSHITGNYIFVPKEQTAFFKKAKKPDTEPGIALMDKKSEKANISGEYDHLYLKYSNIVAGSIYKVQSTASNAQHTEQLEYVNIDGKKRAKIKKNKKTAKGATRCLVICQVEGCSNTRDIKVQDAFQVKKCDECKKKKRKKDLKKFLKSKKNEE